MEEKDGGAVETEDGEQLRWRRIGEQLRRRRGMGEELGRRRRRRERGGGGRENS